MRYLAGRGVDDTGQIVRHLRWALRSYLIEGSRARRFRQAGGSRQTEADGVLGGVLSGSRDCKCWCVKGRMVGVAWTEHGFFVVVEGSWYWVGRYQAVAVAVAVASWRGEAAAATHSSAVVHESESGSLVCCIRPGSWGGTESQFFLGFLVFPFVSEGFLSVSFPFRSLFFSFSVSFPFGTFLLFSFFLSLSLLSFSFVFFSSFFPLDCFFLV